MSMQANMINRCYAVVVVVENVEDLRQDIFFFEIKL